MSAPLERFMFANKRGRGMEFHICVRGELGCVEFHFVAYWNPDLPPELYQGSFPFMPLGVEGHRRVPEGEARHQSCLLLNGDPCHHDGTSLYASEVVMPAFKNGGSDAVYPLLESTYGRWFEDKD